MAFKCWQYGSPGKMIAGNTVRVTGVYPHLCANML
jgi:hypothetical protein